MAWFSFNLELSFLRLFGRGKLLSFLFCAFALGCLSLPPKSNRPTPTETHKLWDNMAKFLAGFPVSGMEADKISKEHRSKMDNAWETIRNLYILPIQDFQKQNQIQFSEKTVLYPFSGTDVLNLVLFFPEAERYVCFGLESPGNSKFLYQNPDARWKPGLEAVQTLSQFLANRNYFTYRVMKKETNNGALDGALPVYLAFLSRMGMEILEAKEETIQKWNGTQWEPIYGFSIQFFDPTVNKVKHLTYWKIFLKSGDPLGTETDKDPLGKFFLGLGQKAVMQKSAEYLMHGENRSHARSLFLQNTTAVLQDDSGFPLRMFPSESWDKKLYGVYDKSWNLSGAVHPEEQEELKLLGKKENEPLPFPFGYGVLAGKEKKRSVLLVIKKK